MPRLSRRADLDGVEARRHDIEHCKIGERIGPDDRRVVGPAVGEHHSHAVGPVDHVVVGHKGAFVGQQHSATGPIGLEWPAAALVDFNGDDRWEDPRWRPPLRCFRSQMVAGAGLDPVDHGHGHCLKRRVVSREEEHADGRQHRPDDARSDGEGHQRPAIRPTRSPGRSRRYHHRTGRAPRRRGLHRWGVE